MYKVADNFLDRTIYGDETELETTLPLLYGEPTYVCTAIGFGRKLMSGDVDIIGGVGMLAKCHGNHERLANLGRMAVSKLLDYESRMRPQGYVICTTIGKHICNEMEKLIRIGIVANQEGLYRKIVRVGNKIKRINGEAMSDKDRRLQRIKQDVGDKFKRELTDGLLKVEKIPEKNADGLPIDYKKPSVGIVFNFLKISEKIPNGDFVDTSINARINWDYNRYKSTRDLAELLVELQSNTA